MVKGLMDENRQPSVQHELERLLFSTRGGGKKGESGERHRVVARRSLAFVTSDTNTNFAKPSTTNRTIVEI